jgi:hypothetical protein
MGNKHYVWNFRKLAFLNIRYYRDRVQSHAVGKSYASTYTRTHARTHAESLVASPHADYCVSTEESLGTIYSGLMCYSHKMKVLWPEYRKNDNINIDSNRKSLRNYIQIQVLANDVIRSKSH